jgi:hypothetical protein
MLLSVDSIGKGHGGGPRNVDEVKQEVGLDQKGFEVQSGTEKNKAAAVEVGPMIDLGREAWPSVGGAPEKIKFYAATRLAISLYNRRGLLWVTACPCRNPAMPPGD